MQKQVRWKHRLVPEMWLEPFDPTMLLVHPSCFGGIHLIPNFLLNVSQFSIALYVLFKGCLHRFMLFPLVLWMIDGENGTVIGYGRVQVNGLLKLIVGGRECALEIPTECIIRRFCKIGGCFRECIAFCDNIRLSFCSGICGQLSICKSRLPL